MSLNDTPLYQHLGRDEVPSLSDTSLYQSKGNVAPLSKDSYYTTPRAELGCEDKTSFQLKIFLASTDFECRGRSEQAAGGSQG